MAEAEAQAERHTHGTESHDSGPPAEALAEDELLATPPPRRWFARHWKAVAGSLVVLAACLLLLRAGALPVLPAENAFAGVRWWTVWASGAIWLCVILLRAARWWWLLAPVRRLPLVRVMSIALVGFGANVVMPFRTGEVVRPALIRKKGELSGWAATGTVGAERIIDGLVLSLFLFVALGIARPLDPLPDRIGALDVPVAVVPGSAYAALLLFVTAFTTMGVFYWRRSWAHRATKWVVGLVSKRLAEPLAGAVERLASGFTFLPQWRYLTLYVLLTVGIWALGAYGVWVLIYGCGFASVSFAQACVVLGVLSLGFLVPNAPGFFGAFQISLYAGLAMFFPPEQVVGPGSAFVFLLYLLHIGLTLILSAAGLLVHLSRR